MENKSNVGMPVKKRLRFRDEDDMALLREVAGQNPFANPEVWDEIRQHIFVLTGKEFSVKTLKDHLDLLIKLWLEKTKLLKDKSGIEEDYSEKDQLCQDIFEIIKLFRGKEKKKTPKKKNESAGKLSRDHWAVNLSKNNCDDSVEVVEDGIVYDNADVIMTETDSNIIFIDHDYYNKTSALTESSEHTTANKENIGLLSSVHQLESENVMKKKMEEEDGERSKVLRPVRSRKRRSNVQKLGLSYLEQYDKAQLEIRRREQALEERKIAVEEKKILIEEKKLELAERKLSLDEYEKKKYLEIVEQQRHDINKMMERQDKIIEILLNRK